MCDRNGYRSIWQTAWPIMGALSSYLVFQAIDMMWIGCLGRDSLAGASIGASFMLLLFMLSRTVSTGAMSLISRAHGRQDSERITTVASETYMLSLLLGLTVVLVMDQLLPLVLSLFEMEPAVANAAHSYSQVILYGAPCWYLTEAGFAYFNGTGRTAIPMVVAFVACAVNAILDPIFLFGWFGFPELGVVGAAWATVLASALETALVFCLHRRYGTMAWPRLQRKIVAPIVTISLPSSLRDISVPLVEMGMFHVVSTYGASAIAALGIGSRITSLMIIYVIGLTIALAALAGHRLGSGDKAAARILLQRTLLLGTALHFIACAFVLTFSSQIVACFLIDETVLAIAEPMLFVLVIAMLLSFYVQAFCSLFQAAGKTGIILIATLCGQWLFQLPLAFLAAYHRLGITTIWWIVVVARLVELFLVVAVFRWTTRGRGHGRVNEEGGKAS